MLITMYSLANPTAPGSESVIELSHATAVITLSLYGAMLVFQLQARRASSNSRQVSGLIP